MPTFLQFQQSKGRYFTAKTPKVPDLFTICKSKRSANHIKTPTFSENLNKKGRNTKKDGLNKPSFLSHIIFSYNTDVSNLSKPPKKPLSLETIFSTPPSELDSMFIGIKGSWRDILSKNQPSPLSLSQLTLIPS